MTMYYGRKYLAAYSRIIGLSGNAAQRRKMKRKLLREGYKGRLP